MQERLEMVNLKNRIEELRRVLQYLIEVKTHMLDPEIITVSEELDELINSYNNIIK